MQAPVLASGYYYPSARTDAATSLLSALPGLGDILSYTVSPIVGRMMWPAMLRKMFGPSQVPEKFASFPLEMSVRLSQMRAAAAEASMMVPSAFVASKVIVDCTCRRSSSRGKAIG